MSQDQTNRLNPILLWAGGIVFVLLSFWGLRSMLRDRPAVHVASVTYRPLVNTISTNGKVEPVFSYESHSPFTGTVQRVYVQEGDTVPKGKLLLAMDDTDSRSRLAAATTNLRAAQARLEAVQNGGTQDEEITLNSQISTAQFQVERDEHALANLQSLLASGAASQSEVSAAQGRLAAAQSGLASLRQRKTARYSAADISHARAQLADAKASYDVASDEVNNAHVTAPFAGTVYSVNVNTTGYVEAGTELLQVADLSHLRVRAYFDEPEIGKLAVGQPVKIVWDAKPGLQWTGHVDRVASNIITYGTRNVGEILIAIDDAPGPLLPNTNVTVTVTTLSRNNVLSIPREALRTDGSENFVYKVVGGRLSRTSVQVGALNLTNVEILSGLSENDVVALTANSVQPLANGAEIRVLQ